MSDFPIFGEKHQPICPKVQQISSRIKKTNKLRYIIVIVKLLELKIKRKSLKQPNIIIMRDDFSFFFKKKREARRQ